MKKLFLMIFLIIFFSAPVANAIQSDLVIILEINGDLYTSILFPVYTTWWGKAYINVTEWQGEKTIRAAVGRSRCSSLPSQDYGDYDWSEFSEAFTHTYTSEDKYLSMDLGLPPSKPTGLRIIGY